MEFDEDDAVKYIRTHISPEAAGLYDDDQLLNIADLVFDYYEANGMLDIDLSDDDEEDSLDFDDLADYTCRMLRKDRGATVKPEHVPEILRAYLEYENSLE